MIAILAIGSLLPSAEKNLSMCICILVHVCLLRGGDACLQSNSSFCFPATERLSPGEAASGWGIIAVAVCPRLCNS